jgi:DNA-directed RNA polymerase specialized sigma24 family protein
MLVRYCARFTGDAFVAEDLAQQTLLEAWRKSETLYSRQVRRALGRRADLGHHVG